LRVELPSPPPILPGAGLVVGTPPPRLGRLEFMLLPKLGICTLPGKGLDMPPEMLPPFGRLMLLGKFDGLAGLACGIEFPSEGLLIGICGAGRDMGIEGLDIPPMLGMLGRAPPPLNPAPPRPPPPPPPRIWAEASSIGPTKPIQPIAKAAGYNQRIVHCVRFILLLTLFILIQTSLVTGTTSNDYSSLIRNGLHALTNFPQEISDLLGSFYSSVRLCDWLMPAWRIDFQTTAVLQPLFCNRYFATGGLRTTVYP